MAGFTSFATTAMQALSLANNVVGGINSYKDNSGDRELKQMQERNALELANLQQKTAQEKQELSLSSQKIEEERRSALRRAIAKQRAKFGAEGIDTATGSGEAVLLGLVNESDAERANREASDALKLQAIDQGVEQAGRVNTLQLTQLKERNKLKNVGSALKSLTDIF